MRSGRREAAAPFSQLGIQLFATASEWTHQEIKAAFDNFVVTGSDVVCP